MTDDQIEGMLITVSMYEKPGNREKIIPVISVWKPKEKHGVSTVKSMWKGIQTSYFLARQCSEVADSESSS